MSWNFSYRINNQQSFFNVQYDQNGNLSQSNNLRDNNLRDNNLRDNNVRDNNLRDNNVRESTGQSPSFLGRIMLEAVSDLMNRAVRNLSTEIETNLMRNELFNTNQPQYIIIRHKNMPNKKEHTTCPICMDDYTDNCFVLETECKHHFHKDCMERWTERNNTCPICRTKL